MTDKPNPGYLFTLVLLLAGCASDTPEQRLRDTIAAMANAVEARESGDFIEHVSEDFIGDHDRFDRQSLRGFLAAQMIRNQAIGVTLGPLDVQMHGDRATVRVDVIVTGGKGVIPDTGDHLDIESGWKLVDGEWECYVAELK